MPSHPYRGLPADQFWNTGVAAVSPDGVDPARGVKFTIAPDEPVATAGSCFAQHISRHLVQAGFCFLQTEPVDPAAPVFSARFGNIYTCRQLRQLLARAYGLHRSTDRAWRRQDGAWIDPHRPQVFAAGFADPAAVEAERRRHLAAVRRVFSECRVFVFTLGLTEAWLAADGTALPVPPGAVATEAAGEYRFHNFTVAEMRADLEAFIADLAAINPAARVLLTVSPVPLVATYEDRHVLVSNTYSKAALRVVAGETAAAHAHVGYFPSYEIITAPQIGYRYFAPDCRGVTEAGVAHVMRVFAARMMSARGSAEGAAVVVPAAPVLTDAMRARAHALAEVLCDEELLDVRDLGARDLGSRDLGRDFA